MIGTIVRTLGEIVVAAKKSGVDVGRPPYPLKWDGSELYIAARSDGHSGITTGQLASDALKEGVQPRTEGKDKFLTIVCDGKHIWVETTTDEDMRAARDRSPRGR